METNRQPNLTIATQPEELATLIQLSHDAIISWTETEGIRTWNDAACRLYGYTEQEALGKVTRELLKTEPLTAWEEIERTIAAEGEWTGFLRHTAKSGAAITVSTRHRAMTINGRRILLQCNRDVTEQIEAKEHLDEMSHLIQLSHDAIISWNDADGIRTWNEGAHRLYGYTEAEALGNVTHKLLKTKHPQTWDEIERSILIHGEWTGYLEHTTKDGKIVTVTTRHQLIEVGGTRVVLETNRDVTSEIEAERQRVVLATIIDKNRELERLNRTLEDREEELEQKNEDLKQFAYIASHDLQEPLRGIIGYTEMIKRKVGDQLPDAAADLRRVGSCATRMRQLIRDFLAFAKAGQHIIERKLIPLEQCVDEALAVLDRQIKDSQTTIRRAELPDVYADCNFVIQLFQNLIGNAIKFTEGRSPIVEITAEQSDGEWIFGVKDNGIGIKPDDLERIFTPFKRLHSASEYEGTGIGLAVCEKIVDQHDGKIWVTSTPGEGSHFRFTLSGPSQVSATS